MRIAASVFAALVVLGTAISSSPAQDKKMDEPKYEMTTYYLALFVTAPNAPAANAPGRDTVFGDHVARLLKLIGDGTLAAAGPFGDDGRVRVIDVVTAATQAEAETVLKDDPAVKAGYLAVEIHPWYAAKNIMKPATDIAQMDTYYFTFLRRGPKSTKERTPETEKIQEAHMGHIREMAAAGKLVLAGPFAEDGDLRGVFIFKVASIDEARALADADPAVKAGRLVADVHPWHVPRGALP
jgi:uncharacterized protein YciI